MPNIIRAIPVQLIRAILVVLFVFGFGLLTACGGGGGNSVAAPTPPPPVTAPTAEQIALVNQAVGEGVTREELHRILLENNIAQREYFERRLRELGLIRDGNSAVTPVPTTIVTTRMTMGIFVTIRNESSRYISGCRPTTTHGNIVLRHSCYNINTHLSIVYVTSPTVVLSTRSPSCFGEGICRSGFIATTSVPLFPIITTTQVTTFVTMAITLGVSSASGLSYSPDMQQVVGAVMADGFNRGFAIGESGFAFSGRHNGNDRAAGFTYDMGGFALRTDYIRLPSKQDGEVMLDTYRFGIIRPINDEARFFAGVDSYKNAILALDVNGDNLHRFGIAAGDGYAVRYEFRVRL